MRFVNWLFSAEGASETNVVSWWELRRVPYNAIVGAIGLTSLALCLWIGPLLVRLEPGEDFIEPLAVIGGTFIAGVGFNLWYTQAWVAERHGAAGADRRSYRESTFRRRLVRSCQIATLPIWLALLSGILNLGRWLK